MDELLFYDTSEQDTYLEENEPDQRYSVKDAMRMSEKEYRRPVIPYLKKLTGLSTEELVLRLNLYQNPESYDLYQDPDADYLTAKMYLDGNNPYRLLKTARTMQEKYGRFQRNIDFLEANLPKQGTLLDKFISPGSPIVPDYIKAEIIAEIFQMECPPKVKYDLLEKKTKMQVLSPPDWMLNHKVYGTENISGIENMLHLMNLSISKKNVSISELALNQDRMAALGRAYQEALFSDSDRVDRILDCYMEKPGGYVIPTYGCQQTEYPGMNPQLKLREHQDMSVDAITSPRKSTILVQSTGSGKTYSMIAAGEELIRTGQASKILFVVPNDILDSFTEAHRYAYPNSKILVVDPEDFYFWNRADMILKIKEGSHDFVYMSFSTYDRITISKEYKIEQIKNELQKLKSALFRTFSVKDQRTITKKREELSKELLNLQLTTSDDAACFDQLGFDAIFVDECQNYKNITIRTRMEHVVGLNHTGSDKCNHHLEKVHYILKHGKKVVFASATPIKGSLADLYALQVYLQPEELEFLRIHTFDDWANLFCSTEETFEIAPNSVDFRRITRLKFHNLTDMMNIFSAVAVFYQTTNEELQYPDFEKVTQIVVPKSKEQEAVYLEIAEKLQAVKDGVLCRTEYNELLATLEGRNCSLDIRLVKPDVIPKEKSTKSAYCAREVWKRYKKYPDTTQIIFCDTSVPKEGFHVYGEVKKELIRLGIPEDEIAFIHDARNARFRRILLNRFNQSKVRVLIGSTRKLGIGVNVQKCLKAIHHLDMPWSPADVEQRDGRAKRQGNENESIEKCIYTTDGSFDSYIYQILENKQRIIDAFHSGVLGDLYSSVDDVADVYLSYSEMKALAVRNPLLRTRIETANHLERMKQAEIQYRKELYSLQKKICEIPIEINRLISFAKEYGEDIVTYHENKEVISEAEQLENEKELLLELEENTGGKKARLFDWYQGFEVILPKRMKKEEPHILLRGKRTYKIPMDNVKPLDYYNRMDHVLDHLEEKKQELETKVKELREQLNKAGAFLEKGNPYTESIEILTQNLKEIDEELENETEAVKWQT